MYQTVKRTLSFTTGHQTSATVTSSSEYQQELDEDQPMQGTQQLQIQEQGQEYIEGQEYNDTGHDYAISDKLDPRAGGQVEATADTLDSQEYSQVRATPGAGPGQDHHNQEDEESDQAEEEDDLHCFILTSRNGRNRGRGSRF